MTINKTLFIGSFLSKSRKTIGPSEIIFNNLSAEKHRVISASGFENQWLRLLEMIFKSLFYSYEKIVIDLFSGNAKIYAELVSFLAQLRGKSIIIVIHGGKICEEYNKEPNRIRKILKRANEITTPSGFIQDYFRNKSYQIKYFPNFIDPEYFYPPENRILKPNLLWVRAFGEIYNPLMAIKVIELLKEQFQNIHLTMIGPDLGLREICLRYISNKGLQKSIRICDPVPNKELLNYYHSESIFLNTTSYESFGVALLEAAACSMPSVSSAVGEIPHIWNDEENILLCDNLEESCFANKITTLLKNERLYKSLSTNCLEHSKNYHWNNIKLEWYKILGA